MFQNKSKIFQKSFQQVRFVIRQSFLIVKDQFGLVGRINMANWDWETIEEDPQQKRLKDFLQSNQLLEDGSGQCLWMSKAMFGFVDSIKRRIRARSHNTNQVTTEKSQCFWNCCSCRREWKLFSVSGQCRKHLHLWKQ